MPPLPIPTPAVVHHMAALDGSSAPPNSLAAIQSSLEAGAACIEVDVTALAAGDYLLVHEPELAAETSGQGPVSKLSPNTARRLKLKVKDSLTSHPPALLSDVVRLVAESRASACLQLDFKNVIPFPEDEPLHRLVRLIEPLGERVIVSTGADWQLRRLRKLAPWLSLGFDIMWYIDWQPVRAERDPRQYPKTRGAYGYYDDHLLASERHMPIPAYLQDRCDSLAALVPDVSAFYLEYPLITQSLRDGFNWAEALHAYGIKLDAWTMDVTNPTVVQEAPRLLEAGVDLFTSNTPRALAGLLGLSAGS